MTPQQQQIRRLRQVAAYDSLLKNVSPRAVVEDRYSLHDWAMAYLGASAEITYLEFGVFAGETISRWAAALTNPRARLFGFDSFLGLPEVWDVGFKAFERGTFSTGGLPPAHSDPRVRFVQGWFQNTVPTFLADIPLPLTGSVVVHFDADLYASTLFVLTTLWHSVPDYHFIMDDFSQDDAIALHDFCTSHPVRIEWLAEQPKPGERQLPRHIFGRMTRIPMVVESMDVAEVRARPGETIAQVGKVYEPAVRTLLMNFESLGSDCELGLVQRRYGAEPLGLFRWANTTPEVLTTLLSSRFRGFASPGSLKLERSPWKEYFLREIRHEINFHTWMKEDIADEAAFLQKHSTRLRWMRHKMMENLAAADRVFVYKIPLVLTTRKAIDDLVAALTSYGPNTLLCVTRADARRPPGSAERLGPQLLVGYLSRYGKTTADARWDICFDEWVTICRTAAELLPMPMPIRADDTTREAVHDS